MAREIDARAGLELVGDSPDDRGVAPGGVRGVTQISDDPLSSNLTIPGAGYAPNSSPMPNMEERAAPDHRLYGDSYDQQLDEEDAAALLQGSEDFDGIEDILGLTEQEWIDLGRRCYNTGRDYYDTGWRDKHIDNSYLFRSEHSPKSKYNDPIYRNRSRLFRPNTRMSARSWEADVASALFMNDDYMTVSSEVKGDEQAQLSADISREIMNIRLREMNWYAVCMGASQDAFINGPVCAKVYWKQEIGTYPEEMPIFGPLGEVLSVEVVQKQKRTVNRPQIDLILPEHLIIDPAASWVDPIGTAGYIVHQKMMSLNDVQRKMDLGEWIDYPDNAILSCRWAMDDEATRNAKRGEGTPDPNDNDTGNRSFETVRVLEVIVRHNGCDYVFDMMGEQFLLSRPVPLEARYHHGRRPFTFGTAMIESHNVYSASKTEIGAPLQQAINEIANNRIDNVKLAMNKRMLVKRGANIDMSGLTRSTPGGVTLTNNPGTDVVPMEVGDVTSSSYQETTQLTTEINELQGTFSAQAVANNRDMNETVGGMEMLSSATTKIVDYDIRTFVNTWVEPTLKLFLLNIQYYEDDQLVMTKALGEAGLFPRLKFEDLDDDIMTKQLMLKVDTGIGATNPQQRINTLLAAVNSAAQLPGMGENLDGPAVARRIFANAGLGTGEQFFKNLQKGYQPPEGGQGQIDPMVQAAQEEAQGVRDAEQIRQEAENQRFKLKLEADMQMQQMELQEKSRIETLKLALAAENHDKDIQSTTWWKLLDNETRLRIASAQDKTKRDTVAVQQGSQLRQEAINAVEAIASQPTSPEQQVNNAPQIGTGN